MDLRMFDFDYFLIGYIVVGPLDYIFILYL